MPIIRYFLYKNAMGIIMLLIGMLSLVACHKEDADGYTMELEDFMTKVVQEQNFQMALVVRLNKTALAPLVRDVVVRREEFSASYLSELVTISNASLSPDQVPLSTAQSAVLSVLDLKFGSVLKEELLKTWMESDQNMIGFHLKAASNSGLADERIRSWAEKKLPLLRNNLNDIQKLK